MSWRKRVSYVWGKAGLDESISPFSNSTCTLRSFPRTIRDAVTVANDLGVRYLWVDRYCVPQDAAEKHTTITNMGIIYENAALTIIAAEGKDSHYGLPGVSEVRKVAQQCVRIGGKTLALIPTQDTEERVENSLWNSRGWTFQEAIMSHRRLIFTSRIVYFQCQEMRCFEDLGPHLPTKKMGWFIAPTLSLHFSTVFPAQGVGNHQEYLLRVSEYFRRTITYDEDGFNAFQGVAERFESKHQIASIFGVLVYNINVFYVLLGSYVPLVLRIVHGLLWHFGGDNPHSETEDQDPIERRKGLPSWTWAGWKHISDVRDKGGYRILQLPLCSKDFESFCTGLELQFPDGTTDEYTVQDMGLNWWKHSRSLPRYISLCGLLVAVDLKTHMVGDCQFHEKNLYSCNRSKVFSDPRATHSRSLDGLLLHRYSDYYSSTVYILLLERLFQEDNAMYERSGAMDSLFGYNEAGGNKHRIEMLLKQEHQWVTLA